MYKRLYRWCSTISQYSKTLISSFYSPLPYIYVVKRPYGLGMGYLLFLVILGATPIACQLNMEFDHFFKQKILFPIESIPLLAIQDGEITYNKPMPYLIKNEDGAVVSVIDTTGAISEINQAYPHLTMLITKNKIEFRPPSYKQFLDLSKDSVNNRIYTYIFDKELNGHISAEAWLHSSGFLKLHIMMKIFIFPLLVLVYYVVFGIALLLLSSLVQLYSDLFFNRKISFKASCRLLSVAVTPALSLFFLMKFNSFALPSLDYIVIILTYISYGLYSVKRFCV